MARLFDDALSQYLLVESAILPAPPFAWGCFAYIDDVTIANELLWMGDKDVTSESWRLLVRGDVAGDPIQHAAQEVGGIAIAETSTGITVNTWHHVCGIEVAADDRRAFLNGGSKGTNGTSRTPANADRTAIGGALDSSPDSYVSGRIAGVFICDLSLWPGATASDKADGFEANALPALANRHAPPFFRLGLTAYYPLLGDDLDHSGNGNHMTAFNGPTFAPHPPMIYPSRPQFAGPSQSRFRLDPTGDAGTNEWTPSAGSDHFAVVDDGLREPIDPASGDDLSKSGTGLDGDPTEQLSYETSSMAGGSASLITVFFWGFNTGVDTGMDVLEIAIDTGGGFGSPVQIAKPVEERWHSAAFAGTFNQAAIDALVVQYTISNIGGGSQSYDFTMEQTYAEVTYVAGAGGVVIFRRRLEAA